MPRRTSTLVGSVDRAARAGPVRRPAIKTGLSGASGDAGLKAAGPVLGRYAPYAGALQARFVVSSRASLACFVPLSSALRRSTAGSST